MNPIKSALEDALCGAPTRFAPPPKTLPFDSRPMAARREKLMRKRREAQAARDAKTLNDLAGRATLDAIIAQIETELRAIDFRHAPLGWIVVGAESAQNKAARDCGLEPIRAIRDQCAAAGTPLFIKQLWHDGRLRKNMDEFPADLRIQQWPGIA